MFVLVVAASAWASSLCPGDAVADAAAAGRAMAEAVQSVDSAAFDRATKQMDAAVACIDRLPSASEVAALHQAQALAAFVNGQLRASRRSLVAARLLDPGWVLDGATYPETHPYRNLFDVATDPGPVRPIGKIAPRQWAVDGVIRGDAPIERAFLLQVLNDDGSVVWSGYVWDWDEIPDYGQESKRSPLVAPHQWWIGAGARAGWLASRQEPVRPEAPWTEEDEGGPIGGLAAQIRFTPLTVVGVEVAGALAGPADVVAGGGVSPTGRAVLLLGGGGWTHRVQPHASARVGASFERFRAWPRVVDGPVEPQLQSVASLVLGAELGLRSDRTRVLAGFDGHLAEARTPNGYRAGVEAGWLVRDPVAVEVDAEVRSATLQGTDVDGSPIGRRADLEVHAGVSVAVWF